jgi:hypothetical protein
LLQSEVDPLAVMFATLARITLTGVATDVTVHPEAFVTMTAYEPEVDAEYVLDVAPEINTPFLVHWYVFPVPAVAVNTTLFPEQIDVGPPAVTVALGLAFTTTVVAVDVAEHPFAFVTLTV